MYQVAIEIQENSSEVVKTSETDSLLRKPQIGKSYSGAQMATNPVTSYLQTSQGYLVQTAGKLLLFVQQVSSEVLAALIERVEGVTS